MTLIYPAPIPDIVTGYLIKMSHSRLIIESDFELTQEVKLEYFVNDEGEFGIPVKESVQLNPNLSEDQKRRLIKAFSPTTRSSSTAGIMINPQNGETVNVDEDGNYPEGSVPEKAIWLNVLATQVPGDKLSDKVKGLLLESMSKMISRGRI